MSLDPAQSAFVASWIVTGLGFGLVIWSWVGKADPIRKQRLNDCGIALVFAGVFGRVVLETQRSWVDYSLAAIAVIFIAASLWRLTHTQGSATGPTGDRPQ